VLSIEGDRVSVPASAFALDGFRAWISAGDFPDGVRATFDRGEVLIEMSPEAIDTHNKVKAEITAVLVRIADDEDRGETFADGALLTHVEAGVSTEPDVLFASWESLESGRLRRAAGASGCAVELVGTPDIVVEIVSPTSVRKDTKLLRAAYARAGIPEYWIIDARGDVLRFEILRLNAGQYESAVETGAPQPSARLGRSFTLTRRRNRAGGFTYRLLTATS